MNNGYKFEGRVVKLNGRDYDLWERTFHAIPDFAAALLTADLQLAGADGTERPRNWFSAVSSKLHYQHQKYFGQERNATNRESLTNTEKLLAGLAKAAGEPEADSSLVSPAGLSLPVQKDEGGTR